MRDTPKEITILEGGLIRLKFPTYSEELLNFIRENYPRECCVWKLEDYSGFSSTGFSHTSWYFEKNEIIQSFIGELKKEWGFELINEE